MIHILLPQPTPQAFPLVRRLRFQHAWKQEEPKSSHH